MNRSNFIATLRSPTKPVQAASSHLSGRPSAVLPFLRRVLLSPRLGVERGTLVAGGNGPVVLCSAGGDVPEIDL